MASYQDLYDLALEYTRQFITYLHTLMPKSRINDWAVITRKHEGWYEGSRSWRNCNPGNIKYGPYAKLLGAYGQDDKGFARFYTPDDGFEALCQYLRDAAGWYLIPYKQYAKQIGKTHATFSIRDFYAVYAPSSENDSNHYAEVVAQALNVPVDTPIKNLL